MAAKIKLASTREEWLSARRLGASQAYKAIAEPLGLWAEFTGRVSSEIVGMELRFAVGHHLEALIHEQAAPLMLEADGCELWDPGDFTSFTSRKRDWMTCTPDRLLMPADSNMRHRQTMGGIKAMLRQSIGHVEFKTVSEFATGGSPPYADWSEEEPATGALLQTQHTLEVLEKDVAYIVALVGFSKLWVYKVERHQPLIDRIVELEERFMDHVERDEMPPFDESSNTIKAINAMYRQDDGTELTMGPEDLDVIYAVDLFNKVEEYRALEKHTKERKGEWEGKVKLMIGEAQKLTIEDHGEFTWKTTKSGSRPLRLRRYEND